MRTILALASILAAGMAHAEGIVIGQHGGGNLDFTETNPPNIPATQTATSVTVETATATSAGAGTATGTASDPGSYNLVISFEVKTYEDCLEKVKKAGEIPPSRAPWKAIAEGADISPEGFCRRLYPDVHPVCDPGPNNLLCTNGSTPRWDGNACRWTCMPANGSCNAGFNTEVMIDCKQGYHRVDDAATCSAQCVPDVGCEQTMMPIECKPGYHAVGGQDSCHPATCVWDNACAPEDPPAIQCSAGSHLARDPATCGWACMAETNCQLAVACAHGEHAVYGANNCSATCVAD